MVAIPVWLTGQHVSACAIIPQTVSGGVFTPGTSKNLVGSIDGIEIDATPELEEISPITTSRLNHVVLKSGTRITLTEILKSSGENMLAAAAVAADYFQITITRGVQAWSFYGARGSYTESIQRGRSVASLTVEMVDIGSANPQYT